MSISEEYKTTKEKYANEILLFQAGIFYRIMEDAKKISDALALKLCAFFKRGRIHAPDIRQSIMSFCAYASHADANKLTQDLLLSEIF